MGRDILNGFHRRKTRTDLYDHWNLVHERCAKWHEDIYGGGCECCREYHECVRVSDRVIEAKVLSGYVTVEKSPQLPLVIKS
jgi:hypothetical protein